MDTGEVITQSIDGKNVFYDRDKNGKLEEINPFKYRYYYHDNETGYYHLQSRYYNPEIGRFINMDDRIVADGNVFAYCSDNPIMLINAQGNLGITCVVGRILKVLLILKWISSIW